MLPAIGSAQLYATVVFDNAANGTDDTSQVNTTSETVKVGAAVFDVTVYWVVTSHPLMALVAVTLTTPALVTDAEEFVEPVDHK
jgi:hypothetical protein